MVFNQVICNPPYYNGVNIFNLDHIICDKLNDAIKVILTTGCERKLWNDQNICYMEKFDHKEAQKMFNNRIMNYLYLIKIDPNSATVAHRKIKKYNYLYEKVVEAVPIPDEFLKVRDDDKIIGYIFYNRIIAGLTGPGQYSEYFDKMTDIITPRNYVYMRQRINKFNELLDESKLKIKMSQILGIKINYLTRVLEKRLFKDGNEIYRDLWNCEIEYLKKRGDLPSDFVSP